MWYKNIKLYLGSKVSCSSAKKSFVPKLWSRLLFQMSQAAGEEDRDDLLHFLGMNIVETAKKEK